MRHQLLKTATVVPKSTPGMDGFDEMASILDIMLHKPLHQKAK